MCAVSDVFQLVTYALERRHADLVPPCIRCDGLRIRALDVPERRGLLAAIEHLDAVRYVIVEQGVVRELKEVVAEAPCGFKAKQRSAVQDRPLELGKVSFDCSLVTAPQVA